MSGSVARTRQRTVGPVGGTWNARLRTWEEYCVCRLAGAIPVARGTTSVAILVYHRVVPDMGCAECAPTWNVPPWRFRQQLQGLLDFGYEPLTLSAVVRAARGADSLPHRGFVVTFDDGYASVAHYAVPILESLQVPATVFVVTAALNHAGPLPFDDWSGRGSARVDPVAWRGLTVAECGALLATQRVELGSHTHTHADFRHAPEAFARDLSTSLSVLQDHFQLDAVPFSYPYGFRNRSMQDTLKTLGVTCALTLEPTLVSTPDDPWSLGRIAVKAADTAATLTARMSPWYAPLRGLWRAVTGPVRPRGPRPRLVDVADWHLPQGSPS